MVDYQALQQTTLKELIRKIHERDELRATLSEIHRIASDVHIGELSALLQIRDLASNRRPVAIPCEGECGHPLHS